MQISKRQHTQQVELSFSTVEGPIKNWISTSYGADLGDSDFKGMPIMWEYKGNDNKKKGKVLSLSLEVVPYDYKHNMSNIDFDLKDTIEFFKYSVGEVYTPVTRCLADKELAKTLSTISLIFDESSFTWIPTHITQDERKLHYYILQNAEFVKKHKGLADQIAGAHMGKIAELQKRIKAGENTAENKDALDVLLTTYNNEIKDLNDYMNPKIIDTNKEIQLIKTKLEAPEMKSFIEEKRRYFSTKHRLALVSKYVTKKSLTKNILPQMPGASLYDT